MALSKITYSDGSTIIHAQNLNDIQDEIITNSSTIGTKQNITDETLSTSAKTIVTAINELNTNKQDSKNLATVATSGSYNDLSNTPSLATVATSGSYNDLSNKPSALIYQSLPSGANLNDYKSLGIYANSSTAAINAMTNKPGGVAGECFLLVIPCGSVSYTSQIMFMRNGTTQNLFMRSLNNGTWCSWIQIF